MNLIPVPPPSRGIATLRIALRLRLRLRLPRRRPLHLSRACSAQSPPTPLDPLSRTTSPGLPVRPHPASIPHITPTPISRETLHRLHRLSALNPPLPGSEDEQALMSGLGELVGLMDLVKEVELPEGDRDEMVRELLSEGVGEVVIDGSEDALPESSGEGERKGEATLGDGDGKSGRQLLDHATRRIGDFYAHRLERKTGA